MSMTFNRDKGVTPNIPVCIITDPHNMLRRGTVTIPDAYLHPRRCFDALIEMGLDSYVTYADLRQLAYWLAAMEIPRDHQVYHKGYDLVMSDYGIKVEFRDFRELPIDGPRH